MKPIALIPLLAALCLAFPAQGAEAELGARLDIPFTRHVLPNGLTLIVHVDRKAPIVAVNVWYHVGAKNEPHGRTGFAHLFEHLMFNGSEHFNDDYFKAMEKVGATDLNGTTNDDRTNYFQNAPKDALEFLLWMESDRMGHLLGAIDQAKLDEQRGVVQNEKRQSENMPYGKVYELIAKSTYPAEHPYSRTVIGLMEDLNAATLDDVRTWFRTYYGAANATLVVAGDVDPDSVKGLVERYFGHIPAGPPLARAEAWIAPRSGTHRHRMEDRVPQARVYKVWNVPGFGTREGDLLNLASDVLAQGKSSRLYKRLVYQEQRASDVSSFVSLREIGGQFYVVATARPGESLELIEKVLDEELARFLREGPTREELQRVKTQYLAGFIRGAERIGGFGGKSDILATYQVYTGDPGRFRRTLDRVRQATPKDLLATAREWLSDGQFVLEVHPYPAYTASDPAVDRTRFPEPSIRPQVRFPDLQQTQLANGLTILFAERRGNPQVQCVLQVDAGYAADQAFRPGTARLAMNMLDEGTRTKDALQISEALDRIGAVLTTGSDLDTSMVSLSALKATLDPALDLFAEVVLQPAFRPADFERLRKQQLDAILREQSEPNSMALRIFPKLLYPEDHAYSIPFTGSGDVRSVELLGPEDMRRFYQAWFHPNHSTLIVVGDTTLAEILPKLERRFGSWPRGEAPQKNLKPVRTAAPPGIYLVDRPGSVQSVILAGHLAPPKANPAEIALETVNLILGGSFTSRINMNLREDKHWSYGARSVLYPARGQRPFYVLAPVQTDKTRESIEEIRKELRGILGREPVREAELAKAQKQQTLTLPGRWETLAAVSRAVQDLVRFGLPEDYFETYPKKVLQLGIPELGQAAGRLIQPEEILWVVVGDRSQIEAGLKELGLGEIRLLAPDGTPAGTGAGRTSGR